MEKLYRIVELTTTGWVEIDPSDRKLTKEEATRRLNSYLEEGYNPNRLRAILDNEQPDS